MVLTLWTWTYIFLFLFTYDECCGVRLVLGPINYAASPSDNVRLQCEIAEKGTATIVWTFGSYTILSYDRLVNSLLDPELRKRYSITSATVNTFDLNIRDVQVNDIGVYACGYIDTHSVVDLKTAKLDVVRDTTRQIYPHCYTDQSRISPHDSVDLNCDSGYATASTRITWSTRGVMLVSQDGDQYLTYNVLLTHNDYGVAFICNVTDLLTGQYKTCRLVPLVFVQMTSLRVRITPAVREVQVGSNTVFTCVVRGLEATERPRFSWTTDSVVLWRDKRILLQNRQTSIQVINIQADDDRTRFTCSVITDTRRRGSTDAVLYVSTPRHAPPVTISSNASKTHPSHLTNTLAYFVNTSYTLEPNPDRMETRTVNVGLWSGLIISGIFVLICLVIITVEVCKRHQRNQVDAATSHQPEAILQDAATVTDDARSSFMQFVTRWSSTVSKKATKKTRRVRFAQQDSSCKPSRTSDPLYDSVAIDENSTKSNKSFFKKPKMFIDEQPMYKNIKTPKNMSNNCSVKNDILQRESYSETSECSIDSDAFQKGAREACPDVKGSSIAKIVNTSTEDVVMQPPTLPPPRKKVVIYADLDFKDKSPDSPRLPQVLWRLGGNEYAQIRNSVK